MCIFSNIYILNFILGWWEQKEENKKSAASSSEQEGPKTPDAKVINLIYININFMQYY